MLKHGHWALEGMLKHGRHGGMLKHGHWALGGLKHGTGGYVETRALGTGLLGMHANTGTGTVQEPGLPRKFQTQRPLAFKQIQRAPSTALPCRFGTLARASQCHMHSKPTPTATLSLPAPPLACRNSTDTRRPLAGAFRNNSTADGRLWLLSHSNRLAISAA